jgi:hypothetical protein
LDPGTARALEEALARWLARETVSWTPELLRAVSREAGLSRVVESHLEALPDGSYRWTLLVRTGSDLETVLAGPYEAWLSAGRWQLEWDAVLDVLGWPEDPDWRVPETTAPWEVWGRLLGEEDTQDPVRAARAYATGDPQLDDYWAGEVRWRREGWSLPLPQVGALETRWLREVQRSGDEVREALAALRGALGWGLPWPPAEAPALGGPALPDQMVPPEGRLVLEGEIP